MKDYDKSYLLDSSDAEPLSLRERAELAALYIQQADESGAISSRAAILEASGITPKQWENGVKSLVENFLGQPLIYVQDGRSKRFLTLK